MSAVMSTLSIISGGRRAHRKLHSSSRKSGQYSDAGDDRIRSTHDLKQQRSASMQTLETPTQNGGVVNLESLEAKMASIEVSLASSRRRSVAREHGRELDALRSSLQDKDALIQSLKTQLNASLSAARLAAQATSPISGRPGSRNEGGGPLSAEERRALEERSEAVRTDLETRKNNINELRRRLEKTHVTENIDSRIQQAELQYKLGREELELLSLSEQARVLHALIQHADHSANISLYCAVRDSGGVATLVTAEVREGSWGASTRSGPGLYVEWARDHTVLKPGDRLVEVNGISVVSSRTQDDLQKALGAGPAPAQLVVMRPQLAAQHTAPPPTALTQSEAASLRSELDALRAAAEEAERAKRGLRADNTRLTHRISYLEEQVADMLADHAKAQAKNSADSCLKSTVNKCKKNVTNISITSEPPRSGGKSDVQVFQKGPAITALVANLPGLEPDASPPVLRSPAAPRPQSDASGASSRPTASPGHSPPPRRSHSSHADHRAARMRHSLSHHCIHDSDYRSETDAALRLIERNQRHIERNRSKCEALSRCASDDRFRSDSDPDVNSEIRHHQIQKAADRIEESIKKTTWAERKTLSIIEQLKKTQRLRKAKKNDSIESAEPESEKHYLYNRIDGKVLENAHKSTRRLSKLYTRSAKSSEFESECSDYTLGDHYCSSPRIDYGSDARYHRKQEDRPDGEAKSRPTPPRKPLRLSLHKARSAHSLINGGESETAPSPRPPSESNGDLCRESPVKKPVKRTHAADRWGKAAGKATPRPARRGLNGLSEAPAADHLYPDSHSPLKANGLIPGNTTRWC